MNTILYTSTIQNKGSPCSSVGKESACSAGDSGSIPGVEDPLEKEMVTQLPGIYCGQRSLVGCNPYEALCKKFILGETLVRTNGETARQAWESYLPMICIWSWYLCLSIESVVSVPIHCACAYPLCLSMVRICSWCLFVHGVFPIMVRICSWCLSVHGAFPITVHVYPRCMCKPNDFPGGSDDKVSAYSVGDPGSIPGLGRFPGEGNGNPLQYSCLENPMDRGTW